MLSPSRPPVAPPTAPARALVRATVAALGVALSLSLFSAPVAAQGGLASDELATGAPLGGGWTFGGNLRSPSARGAAHPLDAPGSWDFARPDGPAPIGVLGDHVHGAGEWMVSYRLMSMYMRGNRDGTGSVGAQDVLDGPWMVVPLEMRTDVHVLGGMYAPTDRLTFTAMVPYLRKDMDHRTMAGTEFSTSSRGWGDARLGALWTLWEREGHHVHLNLGLGVPTGSTDEKDATPAGPDQKLPYPMQLGSGTFDALPGFTYLGQSASWSWGAQAIATLRTGENSDDYTLGDRLATTVWTARRWSAEWSTSLRLAGDFWSNIDGADPELDAAVVPTADPDRRAGQRVDALVGVNWYGHAGKWKGNRLALEVGLPVHQHLDGPQLETDWVVTVGWLYAF